MPARPAPIKHTFLAMFDQGMRQINGGNKELKMGRTLGERVRNAAAKYLSIARRC
jgi:hypothetical protein